MWQTRTGASAMAVELAAALLLVTAVSDALGFAGTSFYLLVVGVPLTAGAGPRSPANLWVGESGILVAGVGVVVAVGVRAAMRLSSAAAVAHAP